MAKYIPNGVAGIPDKLKKSVNTRKGKARNHVYKVLVGGYKYYKFHLKREEIGSLIRYFKRKKDAKEFTKILRETKSLSIADMFHQYKKKTG